MTEAVKPKRSIPQLPQLSTPRFSGGKLASIRKKIDDKQFLIESGIPHQLFRQFELEHESDPQANTADTLDFEPSKNNLGTEKDGKSTLISPPTDLSNKSATLDKKDGNDTLAENQTKDAISCPFCGRDCPTSRMELHQRVCGDAAEKLKKVPFIVKLGIRQVDKEPSHLVEEPVVEINQEDQHVEHVHMAYDEGELEAEEHHEAEEEEEDIEELESEKDRHYSYEHEHEHEHELDKVEPEPGPEVDLQFPGGGNNWIEEHEHFMEYLLEAKEKMLIYASGNFPGLPPPPGLNELETDYVQCPKCLHRFSEKYNAYDHLIKCSNRRVFPLK